MEECPEPDPAEPETFGYLDPLTQSRHEQQKRPEHSASDRTLRAVYSLTLGCVQAHLALISGRNSSCK